MAIDDLARADPIPRVISWLDGSPELVSALGGTGRVGLRNEPPYPRLRVLDVPGGSDRDLRWLICTAVQIEAYGDLSGAPGKAALRALLYLALGALKQLPDQPPPAAGPVITEVLSPGGGVAWSPEPSGQPRYVTTVAVYSHPVPAA